MQRKNSLCIPSDVPGLTTLPLQLCTVTWPSLGRSVMCRDSCGAIVTQTCGIAALLGLLLCLTRDDFKRALAARFSGHTPVEPRVFWPGRIT